MSDSNKSGSALAKMISDDEIWNENKLTHGDCLRICQAIGMELGEKHSREDDARGLAFTVGGGKLTNGKPADDWIAALNGCPCEDVAIECCRRKAVKRVGRWGWRAISPSAPPGRH